MGTAPFDAVLLLSFGGPDGPDDVMPFLRTVTQGRDVPDERLHRVAEQYQTFGGISPINAQNRLLRTQIEVELASREMPLPVYWGNRNWHPMLADTVREMRSAGVKNAAVIVTSGYSSYSGCRQYRENLFEAVAEVEADRQGSAPQFEKMRLWFDHPG
ncbi:MAG: ferrochelatase, partial [Rhodanobacter sp.]